MGQMIRIPSQDLIKTVNNGENFDQQPYQNRSQSNSDFPSSFYSSRQNSALQNKRSDDFDQVNVILSGNLISKKLSKSQNTLPTVNSRQKLPVKNQLRQYIIEGLIQNNSVTNRTNKNSDNTARNDGQTPMPYSDHKSLNPRKNSSVWAKQRSSSQMSQQRNVIVNSYGSSTRAKSKNANVQGVHISKFDVLKQKQFTCLSSGQSKLNKNATSQNFFQSGSSSYKLQPYQDSSKQQFQAQTQILRNITSKIGNRSNSVNVMAKRGGTEYAQLRSDRQSRNQVVTEETMEDPNYKDSVNMSTNQKKKEDEITKDLSKSFSKQTIHDVQGPQIKILQQKYFNRGLNSFDQTTPINTMLNPSVRQKPNEFPNQLIKRPIKKSSNSLQYEPIIQTTFQSPYKQVNPKQQYCQLMENKIRDMRRNMRINEQVLQGIEKEKRKLHDQQYIKDISRNIGLKYDVQPFQVKNVMFFEKKLPPPSRTAPRRSTSSGPIIRIETKVKISLNMWDQQQQSLDTQNRSFIE